MQTDSLYRSCGTLTNGGIETTGHDLQTQECTKSYTDTPNYCNTTPYKDANGFTDGKTVFVKVDCVTNEILPLADQDEAYQAPGVSTAQHRGKLSVNPSAPSAPESDGPAR
jgi:hypothetical protein